MYGPGLLDPMNAEIHFLVRSHGRALAGHVAEQFSTPNGMCGVTKPSLDAGKCLSVLYGVHLP